MALQPVPHKKTSSQPNYPRRVPPLESGDRLSRAEFERRYHAQPKLKKAELIEGVVYMPSPVHYQNHGVPHAIIIGWLMQYAAATPGMHVADNVTVRLDFDNEVQPDVVVRIDEKFGGQSRVSQDDYIEGAPELIVEVAASSAAYDLHDKLHVYRRNRVKEYIVFLAFEREMIWYVWEDAQYQPLSPNENGVFQSRVFPGLHFHPEKFWADDLAGLLDVLRAGMETAVYQTFHTQLQSKAG